MEMVEKRSRLLGLAFLIQFATSFTSGVLVLPRATGIQGLGMPKDISPAMSAIARNAGLVRLDIIMEFLTAAGIIFLAGMLYATVKRSHQGLALTAFGLYVLEGTLVAVTKLFLFALILLSRRYISTGSPEALEVWGSILYEIMEFTYKAANLSFCLGGTIFYAMLIKSRCVPRLLSLWALIGTQGVFVGVILGLCGITAPLFLFIPYIPFELVIGLWLLLGIKIVGKKTVLTEAI